MSDRVGRFWYACWVLFIAAVLSGYVNKWVLIGACVVLTLLPARFDPAIWMKERLDRRGRDGGRP